MGFDNSLRISYANGMDTHYQTEPHILAGAANPTVARRNMSLPGDTGQNLVEWRFRKEQSRGKVIVFGRKLRVRPPWPPGHRVLTRGPRGPQTTSPLVSTAQYQHSVLFGYGLETVRFGTRTAVPRR